MKISVIVPVFNEEKTILRILERVRNIPLEKEIVVVNDGSTDGTSDKISELRTKKPDGLKFIFHPKNSGKGMAIRTGIKEAKGDYFIIQDADLEYNPEEIPKLVKAIKGENIAVYGSRFFKGKGDDTFIHWFGNFLLTWLTNILYGVKLTDMETCYKLVPLKIAKSFDLVSRRFEFEPEITAKLLKKGIKIIEVPIGYHARSYNEGKKINFKDGFEAVWTILANRFVFSGKISIMIAVLFFFWIVFILLLYFKMLSCRANLCLKLL